MSEPTTVFEWVSAGGTQHRLQSNQIPGSAHWTVRKQTRDDAADDWATQWSTEARTKPEVSALE